MDMSKKYYWLKLQHDFFERDEIKIIEAMDNGKDYIIFYMKLLLKSIKTEGELRFSDTIPYNEKMLATITDTNIDIVRSALKMFIELHLIERWSDATLYMIETQNMIGSETDAAKRMRRYRERKALAEGEKKPDQLEDTTVVDEDKEDKLEDGKCNNVTKERNKVTSQLQPVTKSYTEIDIEKEIEIDTDNTTSPAEAEQHIPFKEIIDYLNAKAKRQFRYGKANQRHITARWNEGYRLEDFKRVIDTKVDDWGKDSNMGRFLRPETLFGPKFEGYVNERPTVDTPDNLNDKRLDRYEKY